MTNRLFFVLLVSIFSARIASAQNSEASFQTRCATCHVAGNSLGAPLPETLRQMSWQAILAALEVGKMKPIGDNLSSMERESIAKSLGTTYSNEVSASSKCSGTPPAGKTHDWNGWSDAANTRFQPAREAGLTKQTTAKLKLKWAFGFPGVTTGLGVPSIVDGRVFVGAADGSVYSLDSRSGCVYWTFSAASGVRVAPAVGNGSVYFGDLRGNVYALDENTGTPRWKSRADEQPLAVITGSPKLEGGRLYVPVSGRDESMAATNPKYECCKFRGSVAALDAATGDRIWRTYLVADEPKVTGQNKIGTKTWGPSGVAVWSSPTLDAQNKVMYVGTGVNYSNPTTNTSDAIIALEMDSGRILWSKQFTEDDGWNFSCGAQDKTNCPKLPFIDTDFGNSGILRSIGGGKHILLVGDKSGMVYAVDPDREGSVVWKQKVAMGGINGGTMWGGASDEQGVAYLGISDFVPGKPEVGGGLIAIQLATGKQLWLTKPPKPACAATSGCSAAQSAPVTVIPGVAFLGSWDGHIRAYETKAGAIIWDFDTAQEFQTVNGVKAHGGSIVSMAPVVAGGTLYMTSGYSGNAMPGNVLLAFTVDGK
jgi:polyvinyl alcohol dehydrogenase (cytochrome)